MTLFKKLDDPKIDLPVIGTHVISKCTQTAIPEMKFQIEV